MGHYFSETVEPPKGTSWWRPGEKGEPDRLDKVSRPRTPRATKSITLTIPPILGCLKAAELYLSDRKVEWTGASDAQKLFVEMYAGRIPEVEKMADVLKSIADSKSSIINSWLKENGFDIRLNDRGSGGFAVASILDVLMEWVDEGKKTDIVVCDKTYSGVKLNKGVSALTPHPANHPHPVARIQTKGGEFVYMTIADGTDLTDVFGIARKIDEVINDAAVDNGYDSVVFPMIDYDQKVDISWIEGLRTGKEPGDWCVEEAIQQTKFRMNEVGARAQSAVAMGMRCMSMTAAPKTIVIDKPFLLWVERKGIRTPLFAGVFAEDSWREPRDIKQR